MSNADQPIPNPTSMPSVPIRPESPRRTAPSPQRPEKASSSSPESRLETLLNRINNIADGKTPEDAVPSNAVPPEVTTESSDDSFLPPEPKSFEEAGLTATQIEELIMKCLLARGDAEGRQVAEQIKIPFALVDQLLRQLKQEQMVIYRDQAQVNDYRYQLTDHGRERARRYANDCSYYGAAPVSLRAYVESVKAQSLTQLNPTQTDLQRAFADLLINQKMFEKLGPAINSGRGMFLFGYSGNGKTSIAERITKCFGDHIWMPRAIGVDGEIIRVFDPNHHEEIPIHSGSGLLAETQFDKRWVRVRRPTIIVGGELTMDHLELRLNTATSINESPIQMKSNCGTLVIDDFGRQRMRTDELLNRWIVPLEKRYDFLNLPSGKSIQVPFDQLVVFSTNLEPKDLVDDAFLRRIPYKIEVENPSEDEFIELFKIMTPIMGMEYNEEIVRHLIEKHYKSVDRPFRCCQPRDLLLQVKNLALYEGKPPTLTEERLDFAVSNYFAVM